MSKYSEIKNYFKTVGDNSDCPVDFMIDDAYLYMNREQEDADQDKNYPELPEVALMFDLETAREIRDFLNYALTD